MPLIVNKNIVLYNSGIFLTVVLLCFCFVVFWLFFFNWGFFGWLGFLGGFFWGEAYRKKKSEVAAVMHQNKLSAFLSPEQHR